MGASIGRPQPIPARLRIFPRLVEKLRLMKAAIGLIIIAACISVYVVDASGKTSGSDQVLQRFISTGMNIGSNRIMKRRAKIVFPLPPPIPPSLTYISDTKKTTYEKKETINSPLFPYNYPESIRRTIKIHAGVQFVKLTILYVYLADGFNSTLKDYLDITIGYANKIRINSANQNVYRHATFISTIHTVSITFETFFRLRTRMELMNRIYMYQLQHEAVDYPGCGIDGSRHVVCTAKKAFIASRYYPSLFKISPNSVLNIRGRPGQYIKLHFIDVDLSGHDHVEVFDKDVGGRKKLLWRHNKDTCALQLVESSWHLMEITIQITDTLKSRGFLGRYEIIDAQPFQSVFSTCAMGCLSGQFNFQQSCYSVESVVGNISLRNAEEKCQSYGGHLVSIGSEQEMQFIFSMCLPKTPNVMYRHSVLIGLLKVTDNPCFQWIDGQPLVYTAWFAGSSIYPSQPDGGYDEKCTALMFTNGYNLHNWHDVPCDNYTGIFVCEMPSVNQDLPFKNWNLTKALPNLPIDEERLFRCDTNEIVSKQAVCDSVPNCLDNSDEMNCDADTYHDLQFQCDDGNRIPWASYCDHVQHCKDGSDEKTCSWPECLRSEWKCGNNQCIPKYQRCDLVKHCFDGSDEANCGLCLSNKCSKRTKYDKHTCDDWWISGARWNGTFIINFDSVAIEVICIFKVTSSFVTTITSLCEQSISILHELPSTVTNESTLKNNCSQTVEITCYKKTIGGKDTNYDVIRIICKYSDCKCLGINWKDLDVVYPLTDSITVYDPITIRKLRTNLPTNYVTSNENGFIYITLRPVLCTMELLLPSNENDMYKFKRCIFEFETTQCTDMSHLQNCDEFVCPFSYFKCPQSFCLSSKFVCDGTSHCPNGNDEVQCETRRCPGLFRCRESKICLTIEKVCDDIMHCPMVDDELGCNMACPKDCRCNGSVIVCQLTDIPDGIDTLNANVRKLDISHSTFKNNLFWVPHMPYVGELVCHDSNIEHLPTYSFDNLINLLFLDLSYNRIYFVTNMTFNSLTKLRHLNLAGNLLQILGRFSFTGLKSLQYLNLSSNQLHTIEDKAFDGLSSLLSINLRHNVIQKFPVEIFSPFKILKELSSDLFHFCCPVITPKTVTKENCIPQQDEFSSCKDLIRNNTLRTSIWFTGILSFFGNLGVIFYRIKRERRELFKAHGMYVLNLSISDMLMGIYLLLIATADSYYKGVYVVNDVTWREGPYCKLAGVLSMMSSEASVTFILMLTLDCFLKVKFPFKIRYHFTIHRAIVSSMVTWIVVAVLAILPNLYKPYFADYFFSQTSVCVALPFFKTKTEGWEYSVALFVVYNSVAFIVIAFMQIGIYNAGKSSNRVMKTNSKQDFVLARRITFILVTDFLCWVPIGILGIISLQGHIFSPDVYAWVAVLVLPINSALNPFLYTFSEVLNQNLNKIKETTEAIVYQYSMRNRRKNYQKFDLTIVSSFHLNRQKLSLKIKSLNDVLKWKKLKPVEAYTLMFNVVQRVANLHENGYTVVESINPETVIVYLDKKTVVQAELATWVKKLVDKSDSEKSIEDIGSLTRIILRSLQQQ